MITTGIWTPAFTQLVFKEAEGEQKKGIIMYGVVMPQGEISRNGVLYNWDTVKEKHKDLIGKPVMYNHEIEGTQAVSLGHYIASNILTVGELYTNPQYKILSEEVRRLNYPEMKELWVYTADLDPQEDYYINKIRRGDLRHVSIQLKADKTEEAYDGNGKEYTVAYVDDIIESSIVPTPGFLATCAVLAEKYSGKLKERIIAQFVGPENLPFIAMFNSDDEVKGYMERNPALALKKKIDIQEKKEDVSTTTAGGAVAPALMPEPKKEEGCVELNDDELAEAIIKEIGVEKVEEVLKNDKIF